MLHLQHCNEFLARAPSLSPFPNQSWGWQVTALLSHSSLINTFWSAVLRDAVTRLVALSARYRDGHTGYLVSSTPLSTVRAPTLPSAVRLGWSMELSCSLPRVAHHHHGGGAGRGMRAPPSPSAPLLSSRPSPRLCPSFITITVFSNHCSSKLRTSARTGPNISHTGAGALPLAGHQRWGARPGAELLWSWPLHNTVLPPRRCSWPVSSGGWPGLYWEHCHWVTDDLGGWQLVAAGCRQSHPSSSH